MARLSTMLGALMVVSALAAGYANAAVVTSIPGGTVYPFPEINYFGPGPQTVAPGITWSSTNASIDGGAVFGWTGTYGFVSNGDWSGLDMIGLNASSNTFPPLGFIPTMTIALASPVSAIGGFLNYPPGFQTPTTIAVYDSTDALIESFNLTFLTGGGSNTGQFYGFSEPTADISYFTLIDNAIGLTNLTLVETVPTVPEPASLALLGTGLAGLGLMRRRRRA